VGNMLSRVIAISVAVAIAILAVILHVTQPSTVGPLGILAVFILMYVSVLGVLTFLLYSISRFISKVSASFTVKKPIRPLSLSRSYYFSSVIALAPVMLIGMQSVAEVEIYDVLLITLFVVIACVYISKRTS
jgi:hypothetical protein